MIKKWGNELNSRSLKDKLTVGGRIDTALQSQTLSYLKPLFRKLKSNVKPFLFLGLEFKD